MCDLLASVGQRGLAERNAGHIRTVTFTYGNAAKAAEHHWKRFCSELTTHSLQLQITLLLFIRNIVSMNKGFISLFHLAKGRGKSLKAYTQDCTCKCSVLYTTLSDKRVLHKVLCILQDKQVKFPKVLQKYKQKKFPKVFQRDKQ